MRRVLINVLILLTFSYHNANAAPLTTASHLGSSQVYIGASIPDSSWTECPFSGWVADGYGNLYPTLQAVCAVGEPLPQVLFIGGDIYSPDYKNCMIRNDFPAYAMKYGIRCNDVLEGTVETVPYVYWNNPGAVNLSFIASMNAVAGAWKGGTMNTATGAFPYGEYAYDAYHPNVGTIPYEGVPYIGMPVEATTRSEGEITGRIVATSRSLKVVRYVTDTFEAESAWFTGSLFLISHTGFQLDVADEGSAVYNPNIDQHGNPCIQRNGTILDIVPATDTAWVSNYAVNDLVTLNAEFSSIGRYTPNLHPAGSCIPQSAVPTVMKSMPAGAKLITVAEAKVLQDKYNIISKFLTEPRLAIFRAMPGVQRVSDSADETSVEIGYYCALGEECDANLIHDEILASQDFEESTINDALIKYRIPDIKVVIEHQQYYSGKRPSSLTGNQ